MSKYNAKIATKINRYATNPVAMSVNVPEVIRRANMKVINTDGYIYDYVGIGWVKGNKAEQKDYDQIPQLID